MCDSFRMTMPCRAVVLVSLILAGCVPAAMPDPAAPPAAASTGSAAGAHAVAEANDLYDFAYSWPAAASAIAGLRNELDGWLAERRNQLLADAQDQQRAAREGGFPYHPLASRTQWQVIADLPRLLSLSGEFYSFTGGAHGMSGVEGLIWDRAADRVVPALDLFVSPAAIEGAIRGPFCAALDAERARRRGPENLQDAGGMFADCPALSELTILPGSSTGRAFDRIGLYAGPYVAGPYAEGSYDITLPVTGAVLAAVRPEYRADFALAR